MILRCFLLTTNDPCYAENMHTHAYSLCDSIRNPLKSAMAKKFSYNEVENIKHRFLLLFNSLQKMPAHIVLHQLLAE